MQVFHGHFGRDGAQRVDELTLDQRFELDGFHGPFAQRLRGAGDAVGVGFDAHEELGLHVDAHPVPGDQRVVFLAAHFEAERLHVDEGDLVKDRQDDRPAVADDFFPAEAGADECLLFGGAGIEPRDDQADGQQRDERRDGDDDVHQIKVQIHVITPFLRSVFTVRL